MGQHSEIRVRTAQPHFHTPGVSVIPSKGDVGERKWRRVEKPEAIAVFTQSAVKVVEVRELSARVYIPSFRYPIPRQDVAKSTGQRVSHSGQRGLAS